jgi:hypothetical protein
MSIYPFNPVRGATVTTAPNASNINTDFPTNVNGSLFDAVLVTNAGTVIAFVRVQNVDSAVAASAVDTPILPNSSGIIRTGYRSEALRISVFATAATTVYLTPGEGGI